MNRYFIHLAYDGTNYCGWQIQPNGTTVQETLEKAISIILHSKTAIVGAGRTDAGVHARNFYAHFDSDIAFSVEMCAQLKYKLNRFLPSDISIYNVYPVDIDLHARFSAKLRTYKYYISHNRDPVVRNYAWYRFGKFDIEAMNLAASELLQIVDFTSFSKLHSQTKTNNCRVTLALWEETSNGLVFTISADRFLRNMVRAVVGTLLNVGLGKISQQEFLHIISSKNRCNAGESVPASGLFLEDIVY